MKSSLKLTVPLVEMLVLLALTNTAKADAQTQYSFDLPRQSLASTLDKLAQTANTKLVYSDAAVQGLSAAPVRGRYTVTQALARALNNSGMHYQVVDNRLITLKAASVRKVVQPKKTIVPVQSVKPLSAVSPVSQEVIELPSVTVVDHNQEDKNYAVYSSSTATKTDTPIFDTPVSIQVVPKAVMSDQKTTTIKDALENVSVMIQMNLDFAPPPTMELCSSS